MKKLIIIPAYNEQNSISNLIETIQLDCPDYDYIIINDCSTDSTKTICKKKSFNCIDLSINLGIGGAMQTGYKYAYENDYDIAVQIDADGQHIPKYIYKLEKEIMTSNYDMIIGSRYIKCVGFQSTFIRRLGIIYFEYLIKLLTGKKITDTTSGFRMCNRDIIKQFSNNYPSDYPEPETTMELIRNGYNIKEVPVVMRARQNGDSSIYGVKAIYYMIKVTIILLINISKRKR